MTDLATLQSLFGRWLTQGDGPAPGLIRGDDKGSAEERLDLYAGAYAARLVEALQAHYPGLQALLGEADFQTLGRAYLSAHPSRFRSIRHFGHRLSGFLATASPWRNQPWLAELAAFEWAQAQVFDAANATPLAENDMAAIPPEQWGLMRFGFVPALVTLDLDWNVVDQWQALRNGQPPHEPQASDYPTRWLVWRRGLDPSWRPLDVDEAWALEQARTGATFGAICEGLLEWVDVEHAPLRAAGFLRTWLAHGLLENVER